MKKIEKYIYIILAVILIGIISAGTTYIIMKNNDKREIKENDNKTNNNEENNNQDIALDEKELELYLSYIPFLDAVLPVDEESEQYEDAYNGKKNTIDNINNEILLYKAYRKTDEYIFSKEEDIPILNNLEICDFKPCKLAQYYKEADINKNLLNMYNKKSVDIKVLSIPGGGLFYQKPYYAEHWGASSSVYNKINKNIKGEKINDYIIIEEEALFTRFADYDKDVKQIDNKTPIKIYKNTFDMKNNKDVLNKSIIYIDNNDIKDGLITKKFIDLNNYVFTKYKHIFKKGINGYYWYSTEVI